MSRTDISEVVNLELGDSADPASMCSETEHVIETDERGIDECVRCGYSLQSLVDWFGHNVEVDR